MNLPAEIPVSSLEFPSYARRHSVDAVRQLADNLAHHGQNKEIIVGIDANGSQTSTLATCTVIAGAGRVLAARYLGWSRLRAIVYENLSELGQLKIAFQENEKDATVDAIYQLRLLEKIMALEKSSLKSLATRLGCAESTIQHYLFLQKLCPELRSDSEAPHNLKLHHLIELARLPQASDQIRLARQAVEEGWSVDDLKRWISAVAHSKQKRAIQKRLDPFDSLWVRLEKNPIFAKTPWQAIYRGPSRWGIEVSCVGSRHPIEALARFFSALGYCLEVEAVKAKGGAKTRSAARNIAEAMASATVRLPQSPEEQSQLEEAAKRGVKDLYEWIYGKNSPLVPAQEDLTWDALGFDDPVKGAKYVLRDLKQGTPET